MRRLRPVALPDLRLTDGFWTRWQLVVADRALPLQFAQLEKTGRLENFRRVTRGDPGGYEGYFFNDSDVYKWLEAAAYAQTRYPSVVLSGLIDEVVGLIVAAQEEDGYLNTYFQLGHPGLKWRNLVSLHEMYCAGHLIEAAVALKESLGEARLMGPAIRFADLILSRYGSGGQIGYCGHEEIELALMRLAYTTGNDAYRDLAIRMVEARGQRPSLFQFELDDEEAMTLSPFARGMMSRNGEYSGEYSQDHLPIREHSEVLGHAVRAMYLYAAAAQIDDSALQAALKRCWENLTSRRMYITGGIGPSASNEGFTADFDLPNLTAYAETCAACGLIFWGLEMLAATADSEYADVVELALYNAALAGISLDGERYFYTNPLESRGNDERKEWFACACCPPNVARLIGSVGRYLASVREDDFFIHIPAAFEAKHVADGVDVLVRLESDYPWSGAAKIFVEPAEPVEFALYLRIPGWATDVETVLPGGQEADFEKGYAVFRRVWEKGSVLAVNFVMEPRWVECDQRVRDNLGRVALTRGPLVYCAESSDLGFAPQLLSVDPSLPVAAEAGFGGTTALVVDALAQPETVINHLYADVDPVQGNRVGATFIPYFAWANRGESDMQVWIRSV